MTQAFNLSQLANKVNTSGQLDAATGLVNATPIAAGGTNNGSLAVTAGGVLYTDGSKVVNVGAGTSGQALLSQGASAPAWGTLSASGALNNIQYFTTGGTYTATSGTSFVIVEVVGGGGGGRTNTGTINTSGSSGGYARKKITSGFSGTTVTIGGGGAGALGANGGTGGTSSFGGFVSATGGGGGATGSAGSAGSGSGGDFNLTGGQGWSVSSGPGTGCPGGTTVFGGNSAPAAQTNVNGSANTGAGGGGGYNSAAGGNGGSGIVIVYEYK